jgi:hypothetical protein
MNANANALAFCLRDVWKIGKNLHSPKIEMLRFHEITLRNETK